MTAFVPDVEPRHGLTEPCVSVSQPRSDQPDPQQHAPGDEPIVLVDDFGRPVGYDTSLRAHTDDTPLHLGYLCFLADDEGRVLATRRSDQAALFPGLYTCSVRGHLVAAEPATGAIARRVAIELGLLLVGLRLVLPAFRFRAAVDGIVDHELCPVFLARARGELTLDPTVTAEATWVPWPQYRDSLLYARRRAAPWTTLAVAALSRFDDDPLEWPSADPADLPRTMAYTSELDTPRLAGALNVQHTQPFNEML